MNELTDAEILDNSFYQATGLRASSITSLRPHASERRIFRLSASSIKMIGVINPIREENDCFVSFARFFRARGLPVPEIHHYSPEHHLYLEEDLGDVTLFDRLVLARTESGERFPSSVENLYQSALSWLTRFQIESIDSSVTMSAQREAPFTRFDFSRCYPELALLPGTFSGDCASFATELVPRISPSFNTDKMASDFAKLIAFLERAAANFFVYRDFQSRNIMAVDDKLFFIDFQNGCQGPLQYDVVSLLYQSSTKIPPEARTRLLNYYCQEASRYTDLNPDEFLHYYSGFIISRMVQVLGVYGRLGLGAGKEYFVKSIPAALQTLAEELAKPGLPIKLPQLSGCIQQLIADLNLTL